MAIETANIDYYEIAELALKICGYDLDKLEENGDDIIEVADAAVADQWYMGLDEFSDIVRKLLPLINVEKSGLTGEVYKGFLDKEKHSWIVKTQVK